MLYTLDTSPVYLFLEIESSWVIYRARQSGKQSLKPPVLERIKKL